ncbi:MAG: hypothetical protein AAGE01_05730, partial [Pseudomonadota bacterium]
REFILESHRRKGAEALAAEDWEGALGHFDALLKREPNAREALEGKALADERQSLYGEIERFLARPEGWWSDAGRERAGELIASAEDVAGELPKLATLRARLTAQLVLAEQPVNVTLESDNACNVVVYRVARLGAFDRHELTLKPGRYTAVGTRSGFRDVRREFLVPAGRSPAPVVLRCEEPV